MIRVEITNINRIIKAFNDSPKVVVKHLKKALADSSSKVQQESKRTGSIPYTPIDTGRMAGSITNNLNYMKMQAVIQANTDYADYVSAGTRRMPGRPFMEWALDRSTSTITKVFGEVADKIINDINKQTK